MNKPQTKLEKTLFIIKPEAVKNNLTEKINKIILEHNFKIIKKKYYTISEKDLLMLWKNSKKDKISNKELIKYMTSSESVIQILEKKDAIKDYRLLVAIENKEKTYKFNGFIRNKFATNTMVNAIHASSNKNSAEYEIQVFFPEYNLVT